MTELIPVEVESRTVRIGTLANGKKFIEARQLRVIHHRSPPTSRLETLYFIAVIVLGCWAGWNLGGMG